MIPFSGRKRGGLRLWPGGLGLLAALWLAACGAQGTGTAVPTPAARVGTAVAEGSATPELVPEAGGQVGPIVALTTLHMVTPDEGWATGRAVDTGAGGVLRTTDGGLLWQNVTPPGIDASQIETTFFLDAAHAWLVTLGGAGATTVLRTSDSGRTWERSETLHYSSAAPGWLDFIDPQHGWLMANLAATAGSMAVGVYRTTDGGLTWQQVSLTSAAATGSTPGSLPLACNKTGISFVDPNRGWATGHCTTGGIFFYTTRDAGRTWQSQSIRPPAGAPANLFDNCDCETVPPVFASAQNGVAPVKIFTTEHEAVLYVTQNGGQSWQSSELSTNRLLRPPDFVSASDGWVTDEEQLFLTRDGGRTWASVARLPQLRLLGTLDFVDLQNGWVTGGEQVYRTADGGQTWQTLSPKLLIPPAPPGAATPGAAATPAALSPPAATPEPAALLPTAAPPTALSSPATVSPITVSPAALSSPAIAPTATCTPSPTPDP